MKGMSNRVYRSINSEMLLIREIDRRRRLTVVSKTLFVSTTQVDLKVKKKHRAC